MGMLDYKATVSGRCVTRLFWRCNITWMIWVADKIYAVREKPVWGHDIC